MNVLRDCQGVPVKDSAGALVHVALPESTASGKLELVGAWKEPRTPFVLDLHGEPLLDSDGKRVCYIETPPGKAELEAHGAERSARLARPFVPPTPEEQREWERQMLESWFLVERAQYFYQGHQTDVTTFSHAARCGDAQFLEWALEQGLEAHFDWENMRGYATTYDRPDVVAWIEERVKYFA